MTYFFLDSLSTFLLTFDNKEKNVMISFFIFSITHTNTLRLKEIQLVTLSLMVQQFWLLQLSGDDD